MSALTDLQTECRKITVKNYTKEISIGALQEEHCKLQTVIFNIDAYCEIEQCPKDSLEAVYDYRALIFAIDSVVSHGHIELQETMIDRIATQILADKRIRAVRVASEKTQAYPGAQSIGVEIFKFNSL